MNILYLCDEYPPGQHGGIGTSVCLLARAMVKLGHNVIVAGLYSPGFGGENEFEDEGVKVYRFRWKFDYKWLGKRQSLIFRAVNRILKETGLMERDIENSLASYKIQLEKIIAAHKIDIVEMPDYNDYVRFTRSYMPFPLLTVPTIVKMNGSISYFAKEATLPVARDIFKMEQAILNQAAAVSAASNYTATKSAGYFSYPKKIEVLYNGINTNVPIGNVSKNTQQVIFTGTLVQKKGIYQLAKAWNIVAEQKPDARLLILGKGSRQKVVSLLNAKAKHTVLFMGHVTTEKLYGYLAGSSVAIFPSYSEAFALAPLEAMACGTAVINSNRTSGPELVDDRENGLLIDPDNIEEIARAILYLLYNPVIAGKLAKNGMRKVKECFDINDIAIKNLCFYNQILNR
jgi:glycogen(starch) synthase